MCLIAILFLIKCVSSIIRIPLNENILPCICHKIFRLCLKKIILSSKMLHRAIVSVTVIVLVKPITFFLRIERCLRSAIACPKLLNVGRHSVFQA